MEGDAANHCPLRVLTFAITMSTIDPTKVLSYGAIGLGFLLAFLAYSLILSEQKQDRPRRSIIRTIYFFMVFSFTLCLLGFGSELWKNIEASNHIRDSKKLSLMLLSARPQETTAGKSDASRKEIENILRNAVAAQLTAKCFREMVDRELHGTIDALVYKGSSGYANNISVKDTNLDEQQKKCVGEVFSGTSFPEPTGPLSEKKDNDPLEASYWLTARLEVSP
jgi:hypothetical protein